MNKHPLQHPNKNFWKKKARERFKKFDVFLHSQETLQPFTVKGTKFYSARATYFDHKIPVSESTIPCIKDGRLVTGEKSDIHFVEPAIPPYKANK